VFVEGNKKEEEERALPPFMISERALLR